MSSVVTQKVLTDEVVNVNDNGLPMNLQRVTPHCYATVRTRKPVNSVNVSSITLSNYVFKVTMIKPASSEFYTISGMRNGSINNRNNYTICYNSDVTKTAQSFGLICRYNLTPTNDVDDFSFVVFDQRGNGI